jgi:hypothetical protein
VNRKVLVLDLCLLALLGSLGWMLRARWLEARAHERATLSRAPRKTQLLPPPAPPAPVPAVAADYLDVAAKTLFSKDRDPNVVIEAPPPPKPAPEEPIPPRPVYYGQMALGPEPVAILTVEKNTQKSYQAGDDVGPFKLVAFDHDKMTLEWKGKTLEYPLSDLKPKSAPAPAPGNAKAASVSPPPAPAAAAPPPPPAQPASAEKGLGPSQEFRGRRSCVAGDTRPAGTIAEGYRKVVMQAMMAEICYWEPVK